MGKLAKLAKALDMSKKARMQRAKEMGFDTDTRYIHESPGIEPIEEIHSEGRFGGIFSLPDDRAGYYPNTQEFLLRDEPFSDADIFATYSKNPREASDLVRRHFGSDVDVDEYINYAATFDDIPSSILDDDRYADLQKLRAGIARLGGASSVTQPDEFSNTVQLLGGPGVRSINAAFDPAKKGSPNLMAGVAGATVGLGALLQGEQTAASDFYQRRAAKKPKWQAMRSRAEMTSRLGQAAPVEHELLGDLANKFAAYNRWVKSKPGLDFILPEAPAELVDKWSYGQPTTLADDAEAALGLL